MRYRVKDYTVDIYQGNARVFLTVPSTLIEAFPSFTQEEERKVKEAIRLIIDETAGVPFCSSMQKDKIILMEAQNNQDGTTEIAIYFAIPSGKTIASTDQFTIEMDWGVSAEDILKAVSEVSVPAAMSAAVAQAVSDIDDAVDDAASDIEAAATGASGTIGTAATNAAASISNALSQYLEEKDISIQQTIGFTDVINACEEIAAAIWPEMANYPTPYTAADFDASGNLIE